MCKKTYEFPADAEEAITDLHGLSGRLIDEYIFQQVDKPYIIVPSDSVAYYKEVYGNKAEVLPFYEEPERQQIKPVPFWQQINKQRRRK